MMLPMSLSTITDAHNALSRLTEVFLADERSDSLDFDHDAKFAISVTDADFQWESSPPDTASTPKSRAEKKADKKKEKAAKVELILAEKAPVDAETAENSGDATADVPDSEDVKKKDDEVKDALQLRGINLSIPRGQLCAVVGPVGCAALFLPCRLPFPGLIIAPFCTVPANLPFFKPSLAR
jgi:ATP-binding cassette subfamily C (CFTR/MRP) protein 1